jgi:transposase
MATREFVLNEAATRQLERAEQSTRDATELRRLQAVRLYGTSMSIKTVSQVVQASERTVRRWVERYQQAGIGGLRERRAGGNNRKLTAEQRHELRTKLEQYRPVDLHVSEGQYWTVSDLRVVVGAWYGVVYKDTSRYHALLHESGFSFQRSTKVYRQPTKRGSGSAVRGRTGKKVTDFLQDHPDGQVIAVDEMSLYFQATTTRLWSRLGETPCIRVSPQRDHTHFYGALNVCTGYEFALPAPTMTGEVTANFLRDLLVCYPTQAILLLWDRASWHKGAAVHAVLDAHPRLETVFFPPACPQLNPQEHVWSQARAAVSHHHRFPTFIALTAAFLRHLVNTLFHFDW